ncbi:MAG: DHA1 family inner membrane transport protein [Polaromonas sp.]|jgi:DHA1 family inner membrane transport protein
MSAAPRHVLPVLVLAQFAGTSLWFAVNAVMPDLQHELGWPASAVGRLTSALQLGFIAGTLVFALLAIADRFSPRRVFLLCSLAGALCTVGAWWMVRELSALWMWRAATGFFLAGIYPVGMKIASQWFPQGLGAALGWLIGALVLGTASAHGLRGLSGELPWPSVMLGVAALAATGGVMLFVLLPEAPASPARTSVLEWRALAAMWTDWRVRASVLGYFGHMWELYTLWVLVPLILANRLNGMALSWAAFAVVGSGALGCVGGGWLARRWGSARVATGQLAVSGLCCALAPWLIDASVGWFAVWLLVWGISVAGDSPQFSALTASNAPSQAVGSVLTLTNSIGFAISIVSIELFTTLAQHHALGSLLPWLGLGPLLGVLAMRPLWRVR